MIKYAVYSILAIGVLIGLSYAFGWIGVHQEATIGAAKQDIQRKVFENTQSYIEGKRQEALKHYQEYNKADEDGKRAIKAIVSQSFANFDENKLNGQLRQFVIDCKYHLNE